MKTKRLVTGLLLLTMLVATVSGPTWALGSKNDAAAYSDITPKHWAYAAIMDMTSRGMFNGTSMSADGTATFSPDADMTRAQFITVLTRYLYSEQLAEMQPGETWYSNNYYLALEYGLLTDDELDGGKLTVPCTRQEMSMLLVRAAYAGAGETAELLIPSARIPDYGSVNAYYRQFVLQAYSMGFLDGVDNKGTFRPDGRLNRAQAATVIYRLLDPSARVVVDFDETGAYTWENGITYTGQIRNGEADGYGKMTFPEIGVYVGYFVNGKREGLGTFTWECGDSYVGFWNDDKMTGNGTYKFADGEVIRGVWEDNRIAAQAMYMSASSLLMAKGQTAQIVAMLEPEQITEEISWFCSNESIAAIRCTGNLCTITAKAIGTAVITARTDGGKTASCSLTVKEEEIPIGRIELSCGDYTAKTGETFQLKASIQPANASEQTIAWSSSNPAVASVSSLGVVTTKERGLAVIAAKTAGGLVATCYVVVESENEDIWGSVWSVYPATANGQKTSSTRTGTCTFDLTNMTANLSAAPYTNKLVDLEEISSYELAGVYETRSLSYEIYFTSIRDDLILMEEKAVLDSSSTAADYVQINYYALERQ